MEISEVHVKLPAAGEPERIAAYCSLVIGGELAIHDIKLIRLDRGLMLSMPSRRVTDRCRCGGRNALSARYCQWCGVPQDASRSAGRTLYADVVHPVVAGCRERIEAAVLEAVRARSARVPT